MPNRTTARFTAVVILILGMIACDDSRSTPSIAPSAVVPPPPPGELIRGQITDTAFRGLQGVTVEILDGPQSGVSAMSNVAGEFSVSGIVDDATRFRVNKDAYVSAIATLGPLCAGCNPRRFLHVTLELLVPPVNITGAYTLTFVADSACAQLPAALRTRTYTATIAPAPNNTTNSLMKVSVSGSKFVAPPFEWFSIGVAGNFLSLGLGDLHGTPGLVEDVGDGGYLSFEGASETLLEGSRSTISTVFEGAIEYCVISGKPDEAGYRCHPATAIQRARCDSRTHRLILTPR